MTETKPTNGLLTDRLNNTRTKNRPIWLTIAGSKPTNDWWQTLHESFSQYHHGYTDQSRSTDQTYNIIDWQALFTWLWRWLPLRLSKRQSPTTVLFRTTLTRTITLYELEMCSFCTIYKGDLHHLFYDCSYWCAFWNRFCNWWSDLESENLSIALKNVIVGILNRNDLLNYLITLGKLRIWDCRRNKSVPKFNLFLNKVEAKQETEKLIASKSKKLQFFFGKNGNHYYNYYNYCDTVRRKYVVGSFKFFRNDLFFVIY